MGLEMRVVTVMHDFRGGGAEKVAVMLANEWVSQGYGTEIVCMSEAGPFRALVDDAVSVNCLSKRHAYDAILPLAALLRARRDAIVVAHLTHINVLSLLAGFMAGHPNVFVVEHNDFCRSRSDQPSMAAGIGYAVAPFLYARAQRVICVSQSVRESLPLPLGARDRVTCVIANPISSASSGDLESDCVPHPWFSEEIPVLVACGRFAPAKNYEMMLQALRSILARTPVRLMILGELPRIETLAADLGLSESVAFAGFRDNPASYFSKARLFISSSAWEGLPMTMIEALYAGANMVVTKSCSDAPYLVNDGLFGACVDSQAPERFADVIVRELGRPVASVTEKRQFLAKYSLPIIAAEYAALFARAQSGGDKLRSC